jgi:hypothetical protein
MSKRTASDNSRDNSTSKRTASDVSSDKSTSKRTASDISSNPGTLATPSSPSIQHPFLREHCTSANHYIRQTFLGPICTKCNTKISLLGTLFTISGKTIIRHWKKNNCFIGDIKHLNAKALEKSFLMSITQLYKTIHNNPTLATKFVRGQFHSNSIRQSPYCSRCGYVGITRNVRRHILNDAYNCTLDDANSRGGKVLTDKYQFCIPQEVLDTISSGNFQLPFDHHTNTIITLQNSNDSDGHTSISSLKSSPASILMDTIIHTPSKFLPNNDEIEDIHKFGDVYFTLNRGEGFGLCTYTAKKIGNRIICGKFGAEKEFLDDDDLLLNYELRPSDYLDNFNKFYIGHGQECAYYDTDYVVSKLKYFPKIIKV